MIPTSSSLLTEDELNSHSFIHNSKEIFDKISNLPSDYDTEFGLAMKQLKDNFNSWLIKLNKNVIMGESKDRNNEDNDKGSNDQLQQSFERPDVIPVLSEMLDIIYDITDSSAVEEMDKIEEEHAIAMCNTFSVK